MIDHRVVVCCGAGGVGKTTVSAALGLAAARAGKRALVLTVDPARRLCQAMGLTPTLQHPVALAPERLRALGVEGPGRLSAWMLHPGTTLEGAVRRLSTSPQAAERVLEHRLFRQLVELSAGMQEYAAAEALQRFSEDPGYDLVILDTPPSRNGLELLEAPKRLSRFVDPRVLGALLPDASASLWRKAAAAVTGLVARAVGRSFLEELQGFLGALSGMMAGLKLDADALRALLASPSCAFALVSSPASSALADARLFRSRLLAQGFEAKALYLNRTLLDGVKRQPPSAAFDELSVKWRALAEGEQLTAARHQQLLVALRAERPGFGRVVALPELPPEEGLEGLGALAAALA